MNKDKQEMEEEEGKKGTPLRLRLRGVDRMTLLLPPSLPFSFLFLLLLGGAGETSQQLDEGGGGGGNGSKKPPAERGGAASPPPPPPPDVRPPV